MTDESSLTSMVSLREVLLEIDRHIDKDRFTSDPCAKCNGTNTELVYGDKGEVLGARACRH